MLNKEGGLEHSGRNVFQLVSRMEISVIFYFTWVELSNNIQANLPLVSKCSIQGELSFDDHPWLRANVD